MPQNITYTCDKCGWTQPHDRSLSEDSPSPRWFHTIQLTMINGHGHLSKNRYLSWDDEVASVLWCNACINASGLPKVTKRGEETPPQHSAIEDLIYEMVKECLANQ